MKIKEVGGLVVPASYEPAKEPKKPKEIRHEVIDCFSDLISALRNLDAKNYELVSIVPVKKDKIGRINIGQAYILTYYSEAELEYEVLC